MSGAGEVVCEGWLRKSPPEKKLRHYAWKRRWFVLRSGRLSGEPDVLQYYKNQQSRRPIRTINLNLCEQVDAGLSFTKKELESSFVFDLKTEERTWYLVAESEEDMSRWVSSICLLCGFNPTDEAQLLRLCSPGPERPPVSDTTSVTANNDGVASVTGSAPPPYDPVRVQYLERDGNGEDYLWLSHCQSHIRPPLGSSTSLETDYNDNLYPPTSILPPQSFSSSSASFRTAPWMVAAMTGRLSQSLDASTSLECHKRGGKPRCHPSPHPRKHSLDFHLRPVEIPLTDDGHFALHPSTRPLTTSGYQIPRPASSPQPRPPRRPSSTPSVDSLTQAELLASTPTPPPRPPKPTSITTTQGDGSVVSSFSQSFSEPEKKDWCVDGGVPRCNTFTPGRAHAANLVELSSLSVGSLSCESFYIPRSLSDRASMFEFSESFNSYFINKGMVPLGSVCSEDDDVDENYVSMSAATTEPPVAPKVPSASSDPSIQDANYVPMTPLTRDLATLGRQVPPPGHMGFRNTSGTPATPPARGNAPDGESEAVPPPIHRNLKPQRKVRPAPLDITSVQQDWQEVPPPIRSPVTRTFTRDPSFHRSARPTSAQSSSPSSDSDEADDNYVAMTTSNLSFSTEELMLHRASEGGVSSSPLLQRVRGDKQVEYLDLDLHTGLTTPPRQKRCTNEGNGSEQAGEGEERARGSHTRVDYVVVDPKRTKALKNTREAWHDGRMSTEKENNTEIMK
uniref:PH domain-containing protein n=1 Tax=Tetraodon nigroviridis TaxID=99883 RepID=H3D0Z8_TETNG